MVAKFVKEWLRAADELDERARDLVLSMDGTGRELAASFVGLSRLFAYGENSPTQAYQDAIANTEQTLWQAAEAQRNYVIELMASFEGTPEQIATLADAVSARYAQEIALIEQITGMIQGVQDLGQSTVDRFRLSVMSEEQQYNFFSMQAEQFRRSLEGLTDPAQIWDAFQRGIDAQNRAFDLLSQDQQRAVVDQFVQWTEGFQAEAEAILGERAAQVENEHAALAGVIQEAFGAPSANMNQAAERMERAAGRIEAVFAQGLPPQAITLYLPGSGDSQLGYG